MESTTEKPTPASRGGNPAFYWALVVTAAACLAAGAWLLARPPAGAAAVRGTILLTVTLATVTIALILVLSAVLQNRSGQSPRGFFHGRELLLPLVAILATIVGYSLGHDDGDSKTAAPLAIVTRIDRSAAANAPDAWLLTTTFIDGGTPPFAYELAAKGAAGGRLSGRTHARLLQQPLRPPAGATALVATVTDANGQRAEAVVPLPEPPQAGEAPAPAPAEADGGASAKGGPAVYSGQPVLKAQVRYDADGWVEAVEFAPDTPTTLPLVYFGPQALNGRARLLAQLWPEPAEAGAERWITEPVMVEFRGSGASVEFSAEWNVESNFRAAIVAVLMDHLHRSAAPERLLVDGALVVGQNDSYSLPGLLAIELHESPPEGPVRAPPVEPEEG